MRNVAVVCCCLALVDVSAFIVVDGIAAIACARVHACSVRAGRVCAAIVRSGKTYIVDGAAAANAALAGVADITDADETVLYVKAGRVGTAVVKIGRALVQITGV